jgi:hypothetical protein
LVRKVAINGRDAEVFHLLRLSGKQESPVVWRKLENPHLPIC